MRSAPRSTQPSTKAWLDCWSCRHVGIPGTGTYDSTSQKRSSVLAYSGVLLIAALTYVGVELIQKLLQPSMVHGYFPQPVDVPRQNTCCAPIISCFVLTTSSHRGRRRLIHARARSSGGNTEILNVLYTNFWRLQQRKYIPTKTVVCEAHA